MNQNKNFDKEIPLIRRRCKHLTEVEILKAEQSFREYTKFIIHCVRSGAFDKKSSQSYSQKTGDSKN